MYIVKLIKKLWKDFNGHVDLSIRGVLSYFDRNSCYMEYMYKVNNRQSAIELLKEIEPNINVYKNIKVEQNKYTNVDECVDYLYGVFITPDIYEARYITKPLREAVQENYDVDNHMVIHVLGMDGKVQTGMCVKALVVASDKIIFRVL